jgi:hypothetical protein
MFGSTGGGFGYGSGDGGGAALGEEDTVDSGAVRCAEKGAEVVGVFDAVEGEEETGMAGQRDEVFYGEKLALADEAEDSLVGVGFGEASELVAWLEGDTDIACAGEGDEGLELGVSTLPGNGDVVEAAGSGADGLFDGVQAIKNFHMHQFTREKAGERAVRALE